MMDPSRNHYGSKMGLIGSFRGDEKEPTDGPNHLCLGPSVGTKKSPRMVPTTSAWDFPWDEQGPTDGPNHSCVGPSVETKKAVG